MPLTIILTLILTVTLTGCGAGGGIRFGSSSGPDDGVSSDETPNPGGADGAEADPRLVIAEGPITEPGMSVADALGHLATDDLVTVRGALFVEPDGTVYLCEAIAESFPPQCGGQRLRVEGLDLDAVASLQSEGDVSWAESIALFGSVE